MLIRKGEKATKGGVEKHKLEAESLDSIAELLSDGRHDTLSLLDNFFLLSLLSVAATGNWRGREGRNLLGDGVLVGVAGGVGSQHLFEPLLLHGQLLVVHGFFLDHAHHRRRLYC